MIFRGIRNIILAALLFSSCKPIPIVSRAPKNKPYLFNNKIELRGGKFTTRERETVLQRLANQLDDSSKVPGKDILFLFNKIKRPPAYDSAYSSRSANNMKFSMFHLGYYNATAVYMEDTAGRKVTVTYVVEAGKPTLIDTVSYRLSSPDLQQLATASKKEALLAERNPVTKTAVLGEVSRLVDTFRNNGYYKFTAAELRVLGDTTIAALTTISDDPFEQLRLLQEASRKTDSPEIRLSVVINKPDDSTRLSKYHINKMYILYDFRPEDVLSDTLKITQRLSRTGNFILRYHQPIFRTGLFARNVTMRPGDVYSQKEFYHTLNNLTKLDVWRGVNIRPVENLDEPNKVDLVFELIPQKKYGFEAALEASYSAVSNTNTALGGNLFGLSTNFSLINRNIGREAIRMTHNLRAGVELNNRSKNNAGGIINSNELSYNNNVAIPRLITPFSLALKSANFYEVQSFANLNLALTNRLNLFNLQSVNFNLGFTGTDRRNVRWTVRIPNVEFSYLTNQSDSFRSILSSRPFLRYSYNTSFILGLAGSAAFTRLNPVHPNSLSRERSIRLNAEESGLTIGRLPIVKEFKRNYLRLDGEYKYTVSYTNDRQLAVRFFAGVGIPLRGDTSLPFFKQYFGGGSNSMRGWPVRGIGRGSQPLIPFDPNNNVFNDRTGDMQLETNIEYRYTIARIVPDLITLRGAVFTDIGNIWNLKDSKPNGMTDSAVFKFANLYRDLGLSAGTGFRLDFTYLTLRFDLAFRFKRPESAYENNGWKAPPIGFDDFVSKIFSRNYRQWRYENFNFTIGINYPF